MSEQTLTNLEAKRDGLEMITLVGLFECRKTYSQ